MNKVISLALVATFSLLVSSARADRTFTANITHDQEVANPPIPNEGSSGTGIFVLNDAMTQLTYNVTLVGLDLDGLQTPGTTADNVTRIHFHNAAAGANGGIVYGIIDTNAALRNDNNPNDLVVNAVAGTISGVWNAPEGNATTLTAQLSNLLNSRLYFNVHTADHAGGEIRGQVVPEPSTFVLGSLALAGMAVAAYRRRRSA